MITDAGIETTRTGEPRYNFFSQEIFGIEKPLQQIVEYFHSATQRLEVRKRIMLMMGPEGVAVEQRRRFFADGQAFGQTFIYGDSSSYVGIAVRNGNAAKKLGVGCGASITYVTSA